MLLGSLATNEPIQFDKLPIQLIKESCLQSSYCSCGNELIECFVTSEEKAKLLRRYGSSIEKKNKKLR